MLGDKPQSSAYIIDLPMRVDMKCRHESVKEKAPRPEKHFKKNLLYLSRAF